MAQQTGSDVLAESTLLDQPIKPASTNQFDDVPIGGGNKFAMSEYPSQNDAPPPPRKVPLRKAAKVPKKEDPPKQNIDDLPIRATQPLDEIPVGGNNPNTFDQKPIGKTEFNLSQFPEGGEVAPVETNYTMMQKLKSKAAKMRLSGMEDLLALLENDPDHPDIAEIVMPGLLKETTPANIEKIVQCLKIWVQKGKDWGEDQAKNAIDNGYINGKTNSRKTTVQVVDLMYEQKPAMIEMLILTGFKNKTPKIVAGYMGMLNELLAIYGIKRMNYLKPYIPEISRIVSTQKLPAVKNEGMNTLKSAYQWLGKETIEPMLKDLKEGLKKELDTFWEAYDKSIVMTAPKDIKDEGTGKGKGKKIDAYDLSEAVDVFKKFNQKWAESVLKAQKWNEKTKLMEQFTKAASVPKIANTDNRHITEIIRRLINDSNFNVVLWNLKMMAVMSKGLRKHFGPFAKSMFSNVIAKFRDKKTLMVEETFKTLNDLNYCLAIEDVLDDVKEGLNDKAPNMRCNLLNWIGKYVEQKSEEKGGECPEKTRDSIKQLFSIFQKLMTDGVAEVRETMAKNLGKLELILGQDFFGPIKGKLNKNLASKIVETKASQIKQSKNTKQANKKNDDLNKSNVSLKPMPPAPGKKVSQPQPEIKKLPEKQASKPLQCFDEPSFEDSLQTLIGLGFPEQQVKNVTANGAKQRGSVLNYMKQNPYDNFNAVLRVIRKVFKDWKEVNLMMNKDLIAYIEERVADIGKEELYVLIPFIVEKIGDSKFSQALYRIINDVSRRIPGRFIIGHVIRYIKSTEGKKPKLNGDACTLLVRIIQNISLSNAPVKDLADYAKETYSVSFSKKGAVQLLNCLYAYQGEALKAMLDEATNKGMDPEFKNVKLLTEDMKKPRIDFQGEAAVESKVALKKVDSKVDNKPRDLSADVQRLLPKMNDNQNWQNRKEAAEALSSLMEQGGKVNLGNLTDLLATLKNRINDPNKQLIKVFVHLAGLVVCSLSQKDVKANIRLFIAAFVEGLSDKNEQNRKEIHLSLNKIGETLGKEQLLSNLGPYLDGDKDGRLEVINLILNNQEGIAKADIRDYPKGLVNCLCDKNKDIRSGAEKLFEKVYEKLGLEIFRSISKDQRPAVAKDLNTFLDKFDKNLNTVSSFASKGNSPSKISDAGNPPKSRLVVQQQQPPPPSAKKRSLSKNNTQKSFIQEAEDPQAATMSNFAIPQRTLVQGNETFANIKILAKERAERQSAETTYVWRFDEMKESQQESLLEDIEKLIRPDLTKRLLSFEYKRVLEGVIQIMKLCKDVSNQGHIRQIYDILFKWILLRLWGGQPGLVSIIEMLPPIMSILEKKGITLNDFQVELSITIIREYFISASLIGFKISESLYSIITCLIALSSGAKVLKKILKQFTLELTNIHKHLKPETCLFYREGLNRLVKTQLIEYVSNEDMLEQASKIKELRDDNEFVDMLYRRLHPNVLECFGFKRNERNEQPKPQLNNSNVIQNPQPTHNVNNTSYVSDRDKSSDRLPPRGHQTTNTMVELRPSTLPTPNVVRRAANPPLPLPLPNPPTTTTTTQIAPPPVLPAYHNNAHLNVMNSYQAHTLDLSIYVAPHPACPLGKQLGKLLPPNDPTINFFNSLFTESGQKIVNELTTNSKIIFGSILKSVQELISNRRDYTPDRIVAQITLLQNCIKCNHVVKNIGELLGYGTRFALSQLVYEDENKAAICEELRSRNIEYKSDNFIKAINGVMLRLLENANSQDIVNVLLELLTTQSRAAAPSAKTISLIVKCLGRVIVNYIRDLRPEATKLFILRANEYLATVAYDTALEDLDLTQREQSGVRIRPDDSAANSIKTILVELCKAINSEIWQYYDKAMQESRFPDRYLASYITSLNIRQPEKPRNRSQQKQNDELRKINESLSKTKSFDSGISQLKKYITLHPEFSPLEYFTALNYDQKFISMVVSAIDGMPSRKTPLKDERPSEQNTENIQDKIKKLKQKFQELQPESATETNNSSMNRGRGGQGQEEMQSEERAQEIRRRIEEMKNKMSTAVNRPRP